MPRSSKWFLPSDHPTKPLYTSLLLPKRAPWHTFYKPGHVMVITFSSVKNAYARLANTRGEQTERTGKMREKLNTAKKKLRPPYCFVLVNEE